MGATCSNEYKSPIEERKKSHEIDRITKNNFVKMYSIGKGGFGRVWKVQCKKTKKIFAMKEMSKVKVYQKKSVRSILYEHKILCSLHHPLIANIHYAFQDSDNLYLVLDFLSGGDLRFHMNNRKKFPEEQTKFFVANILLALDYLNLNGVIHRDIKPENLVFDENGYLHLTDFGIARNFKKNKQLTESSGTPGYMAPEVLLNKPQSYEVDYFALGVITYELVFGKRPYKGHNRKEIVEKMLYREVSLKPYDAPNNYDCSVCDFITRLLKRKPKERLGHNGSKEIMEHPWLRGINWESIACLDPNKAPYIPKTGDNFDILSANKEDLYNIENYDICLRKINNKNYFDKFYYNYYEESAQGIKSKLDVSDDTYGSRTNIKYLSPQVKASHMLDPSDEEEAEFELEGNFESNDDTPATKTIKKTTLRRGWSLGNKNIN